MSRIAENLRRIRERIERAAARAGRPAEIIRLVAVSKTFPAEAVLEAAGAGQSCFGENRVQEAEGKIAALRAFPGLEWHLIGHLQSNKARRAAELFDMIHSLDSVRLAARISQAAEALGRRIPVLIQVDLGHEATKSGADERDLPEIVEAASALPGIRLDGLMTLPPLFDSPEAVRPYFARLRLLRETLQAGRPGCLGAGHLSMGMSHDFEAAIEEGATLIRVGTSVFGERGRD